MRYLSTRGGLSPAPFLDILLSGLAPDGGLSVPQHLPTLDLATLRPLNYRQLVGAILTHFIDDIPADELQRLIDDTYTAAAFGDDDITPLKPLDDHTFLLALSNGPTLAFKDIAMQLIGQLFEYTLSRQNRTLNILGATSGDTGSAAEYAMRGKSRVRVFMLSPAGRMSAFQVAQMYSLHEANIFNLAVDTVFDRCQDLVKAVNQDAEFKAQYRIGAVNSINWARVLAQVVYYFKGYFAVTTQNDERVAFSVPSGNFGNAYAGYLATQMGLPLDLIVATNENDVLCEFFRTGQYRVRPAEGVHATSSPSMDIAKASNFERYIYHLTGNDPLHTAELWRQVEQQGGFDAHAAGLWPAVQASGLRAGSSHHAHRLDTLRQVYRDTGLVIDTHTADGLKVGRECAAPGQKLVVLETALPTKFETTVKEALGFVPERPAHLRQLEDQPQRFTALPPAVEPLKAFIAQHGG